MMKNSILQYFPIMSIAGVKNSASSLEDIQVFFIDIISVFFFFLKTCLDEKIPQYIKIYYAIDDFL